MLHSAAIVLAVSIVLETAEAEDQKDGVERLRALSGTWAGQEMEEEGNWVFAGGGRLKDGKTFEGKGAMEISADGKKMTYTGRFTMDGENLLDLIDVAQRVSH